MATASCTAAASLTERFVDCVHGVRYADLSESLVELSREERLRKFYSCALRMLDRANADRLIELVDRLERLRTIAPIADIVRTPCRVPDGPAKA